MTNRQKRLCHALLEFYDESGAQPYPLAQLARKTGYDASDIYDKDSQSGDLWPFDPKARGNYAGMLSFTSGKNLSVIITAAGLAALDNLCKEEPPKPKEEVASEPVKKVFVDEEEPVVPPKPPTLSPAPARPAVVQAPAPLRNLPPAAQPVPPPPKDFSQEIEPSLSSVRSFSSDEIALARSRFNYWLRSEEALKILFRRFDGEELIEAALEKFFDEFLQG